MTIFVMIHGAWHGGWCFDQIRPLLEQTGHRVITPDLPGMGGTPEEMAAVSLSGWADYVSAIVTDQQEPVILVGHSRGGVVISEVAERIPDKIRALVYVTAFLVPSGRSLNDEVREATRNEIFESSLMAINDRTALTITKDGAMKVFYQLSPPDLAAAAAARLVAEPAAPMITPVIVSPTRFGRVERHYIACRYDNAIDYAHQLAMVAEMPCETVVTLESDHSPFICCPNELAAELLRIEARSRP